MMRCPIVMKVSHIVRCCMTRFGNQDQFLIKTNMSLICPQGHSMPFASASGRTDRYKGGWRCDICNRSENRDVARYVVNFSMYRCSILTFCSRFAHFVVDIGATHALMMFVFLVRPLIDAKNRLPMLLMRFVLYLLSVSSIDAKKINDRRYNKLLGCVSKQGRKVVGIGCESARHDQASGSRRQRSAPVRRQVFVGRAWRSQHNCGCFRWPRGARTRRQGGRQVARVVARQEERLVTTGERRDVRFCEEGDARGRERQAVDRVRGEQRRRHGVGRKDYAQKRHNNHRMVLDSKKKRKMKKTTNQKTFHLHNFYFANSAFFASVYGHLQVGCVCWNRCRQCYRLAITCWQVNRRNKQNISHGLSL